MNFGEAVEGLKKGRRASRQGWNGRGMWIELQRPDAGSKMTIPYIYMKTVGDDLTPWNAAHSDVLAEDWLLS